MQKQKRKHNRCKPILCIAIASMVMCCAVLFGTAFAWMTDTVSNKGNRIKAKKWVVEVTAKASTMTLVLDETGEEQADTANTIENGVYTFAEDGTILFTITAKGTATIGYCNVYISNSGAEADAPAQVYCTEQLTSGTPYAFTITANAGTTVTFEPYWGVNTSADGESVQKIENAAEINLYVEQTAEATASPSPSPSPTASPEASAVPTAEPTAEPTAVPTVEPKAEPTAEPTAVPTAEPTAEPTASPAAEATESPSPSPAVSAEPTASEEPASEATASPSPSPTASPEASTEPTA